MRSTSLDMLRLGLLLALFLLIWHTLLTRHMRRLSKTVTSLGMHSSQVQASLAQARLMVRARQLQAPEGDRRRKSPAQPLEAGAFSICQRRHSDVQPQVTAKTGQLVLHGALKPQNDAADGASTF